MKRKHFFYILAFACALIAIGLLVKRIRLLEYFSITKNTISVRSLLENSDLQLVYIFEDKRGNEDSLFFSIKDKSEIVLPDHYGGQGFSFYINGQRWKGDMGYFKFRDWYKFKGSLSFKKLRGELCIAQFDLYYDGKHDRKIDTIAIVPPKQ